jgi:metallo-beta-lactamase class B
MNGEGVLKVTYKAMYQEYLNRQEAVRQTNPLSDTVWLHQTKRYVQPFCIYGNLYYVGDSWVCVHIVDTGNGLLMFDAGNCGSNGKAILLYSIFKLGFDPADIKWCVLSHAHVDHIGCAAFLKEMFGTRLYISDVDAKMMEETPELTMLFDNTDVAEELFVPDYRIQENETIKFGNTEVLFRLVPGHTPGTLACFFDVKGKLGDKRAGYFGGYGFNTLKKEYLIEIGDTEFKMRNAYLQSIDKVIDEPVDIFIANHTDNGDYMDKIKALHSDAESTAFIDPMCWKKYLTEKKTALKQFMENVENN